MRMHLRQYLACITYTKSIEKSRVVLLASARSRSGNCFRLSTVHKLLMLYLNFYLKLVNKYRRTWTVEMITDISSNDETIHKRNPWPTAFPLMLNHPQYESKLQVHNRSVQWASLHKSSGWRFETCPEERTSVRRTHRTLVTFAQASDASVPTYGVRHCVQSDKKNTTQ